MATPIDHSEIDSAVSWRPAISVLLPHPPIAVPAVSGDRGFRCQQTTEACRQVAKKIVDLAPERLILISPHTPRDRRAFGLVGGDRLFGDLGRFGAPATGFDLPGDPELATSLEHTLSTHRHSDGANDAPELRRLPSQALDHGAVVPLFFLAEAGWTGATTVIALPWQHSAAVGRRFGRRLAQALAAIDGEAVLVASGDMSHRCLPDAPAGFHPRAAEFDRELTRLVAAGEFAAIAQIDPELRELAAEDTSETALIVTAAHDFDSHGAEVISYEHPFGVGYLVAVFYDGSSPTI